MIYEVKTTEYDTDLYINTYFFREEHSANIIASFTLLDHTDTMVELINHYGEHEIFEKAFKLILDERDSITIVLLSKYIKENNKFPFESILNNYAEYNNEYLRYEVS